MHWLSIVGILLIAAGTFCTYWGTELRNRGGKTSGKSDSQLEQQLDELRTEQESLLKQAKLIGEENDRLRADNTTLTLKQKRAEEDAEVYKYRATELQKTVQELREGGDSDEVEAEVVEEVAASQSAEDTGWGKTPPSGTRPRQQGYDDETEPDAQPAPVRDTVSEMEIIEQLRTLMDVRNYEELEQVALEQVTANPDWMTPYVYLGVAERHLGKRQKALSHFVYVVENGAGDPAYPQAERALKLMTSGIQELAEKNEWGQLAAASEKQLNQDPDWYLPYYFGGLAYAHLGQKEKAIEFLDEFIAQGEGDPEYGKALRAMRLLKTNILELQRKGDYPALIRACEHEIENDPTWATPHYLLGLSYARLGNVAKAKEHLEVFVNRAPDDPDYNNARRLLNSIR